MQNRFRAADRERPQLQATEIQNIERNNMTASDFAEQVFNGNFHVVEEHRGGGAAANTHLLFFVARVDAGEFTLDEEGRELLSADLGKYSVESRFAAVGDPHLLTVQHVVGAVFGEIRTRLRRQRIGPGLRFGQTIRAHQFTAGKTRQIFFLLGVRAEQQQRQRSDACMSAMPAGK